VCLLRGKKNREEKILASAFPTKGSKIISDVCLKFGKREMVGPVLRVDRYRGRRGDIGIGISTALYLEEFSAQISINGVGIYAN